MSNLFNPPETSAFIIEFCNTHGVSSNQFDELNAYIKEYAANRDGEPLISFTVYGDPTAQKRHRHHQGKGMKFVATYDPSKKDKENFLLKCMDHRPEVPFKEPLKVKVDFFFPRPKSHYGTGKNALKLKDSAPSRHISRPDLDNCIKFVKDALNSVYWSDDSIVCEMVSSKSYDKVPRTEISIYSRCFVAG